MTLSAEDQAKLKRILKYARELEEAWPNSERNLPRDLSTDTIYQELKKAVASCAMAEAEGLKRLSGGLRGFHDQVSLSHFYACIVPFERLANRSLRDDEFLVVEGDLAQKQFSALPLKVIAENLRSAFNVGALFRTAECLGVAEILLCGYTPGPDDEKTARTAMGTSQLVAWRRVDRGTTACEQLRKEGYTVIALETAARATSLHEIKFTGPVAFVLGNERFGLDGDTLQAADFICRIPVRGVKNSMNVGVAFGIAAFEWLRQFGSKA